VNLSCCIQELAGTADRVWHIKNSSRGTGQCGNSDTNVVTDKSNESLVMIISKIYINSDEAIVMKQQMILL
jgi:hypothetical protein